MDHLFVFADLLHEFLDAVLVKKAFALLGPFILQNDLKPGIQERQFAQTVRQNVELELRRDGKNRRIRLERNEGASMFRRADDPQFPHRHAAREFHVINLAIARDFHLEPVRKRVDAFGADAMQPTGVFVCSLPELAARVKVRKHQFDRRHFPLRMHVHGNPTPVISN